MKRILFATLVLAACSSSDKKPFDADASPFEEGVPQGSVVQRLEEASGLVASAVNSGMFWTHNDSGHPAEVFLIDSTAQIRMVCTLKGVKNRDWEEIAMGPGPDSTKSYLYVGDIGDNEAKYANKIIYRFEEPLLREGNVEIVDFDTLVVKLDDGVRDSEAFAIDPSDKSLYIFSKREDSIRFYQLTYPFDADTLVARYEATLPFHNINAADISPDGSEVLIKDYENVYYWKRAEAETFSQCIQRAATVLPYKQEQQGEAITFDRQGNGYYTLSESPSKPAELRFYKRK